MIKELMHDPIFLGGKSEVATKDDIPVANDLLETLAGAPRLQCIQSEVLYPLTEKNSSIREICEKFNQMHKLFKEFRAKKNI